MTITEWFELAKTFGIAIIVAAICIAALYKIGKWIQTQFEDNDKERKETIDKLINQIITNNTELVAVVKNNSMTIENCTRTLEQNSKIMTDFSSKMTFYLDKK